MIAFLIDEMFPIAAAALLRDTYGHDAVHVAKVGLRATEDAQVAAAARGEGRAAVTENIVDFAAERDVVLVFLLKKTCPRAVVRPPRSPSFSTDGRRTIPTLTSVLIGH